MTLVQHARSAAERLKQTSARKRVAIENVSPQVDCGRFPVKRVVGQALALEADIFADGHDQVAAALLYRPEQDRDWVRIPMRPLDNDRFTATFSCSSLGTCKYTLEGWPDPIATWRADLLKRIQAAQDVRIDLLIGASLIEEAAMRARGESAERLWSWAARIRQDPASEGAKTIALREDVFAIARAYPDPRFVTRFEKELTVVVERERACFSAWYEIFPRSFGSFRDFESWLPYVAGMGFDVLYFPPIHPIGRSFRKGRNNLQNADPGDAGSPWAIGSYEGGHTAIHPELGTMDDFQWLQRKVHDAGLEIALDLAFQVSPDHPYVRQHPEWFRMRPDGTIQYAENPPKKYQDIYPFDFSSSDWAELWVELEQVVEFWIDAGVRIFRVDNPHTKPFAFWEWLIAEARSRHPEVIFLAEAFTRPKVMHHLAKLGFSQSYTYFAWRNTRDEIVDYFRELAASADYFRPNLWPNTPDILTSFLQSGRRSAFEIRFLLAATLGASYGIYGPAFELTEHEPREPGSEEYLHSEKFEHKHWDLGSPDSLRDLIARVNRIRRENVALHSTRTLRFHATDNPNLICYSKTNPDLSNVIVVVVNLDPANKQWGFVELDLGSLGIDSAHPYQAVDLLHGDSYIWQGSRNYVELTPGIRTGHILRLRNGA
jgi:starch synthase (maltosyl-transferring)